jgi:glycine betaine catabolism A
MTTISAVQSASWQGLFHRLLEELDQRESPEWDSVESEIDSSIYTGLDRFQAEMAQVFRRMPLCLGHADQLREPGSVLAREVAGFPLLVLRDASGSIGVFLNACRHRGARLVTKDGLACRRSLSCLYHGWTYDLSGALISVPRQEAFPTLDKTTRGLRRLPSTVRHGLIWVVLDPASDTTPEMAGYLDELDTDLAALGVGQHRFFRQHAIHRAANWKLVIDAFIEVYHVKRLHSSTIGPFFTDTKAVSDHIGLHQRMLVAREGLADARGLAPEQWSPQVHGTLVHFIFPNTILVYHPDYISHIGIFPSAPDRSLFVHTMLVPEFPGEPKAEAHWDRSFDLIDGQVFNGEDLFICEQIQRGLVASASDKLLIGRFESNLRRFHETVEAVVQPETRGAVSV